MSVERSMGSENKTAREAAPRSRVGRQMATSGRKVPISSDTTLRVRKTLSRGRDIFQSFRARR